MSLVGGGAGSRLARVLLMSLLAVGLEACSTPRQPMTEVASPPSPGSSRTGLNDADPPPIIPGRPAGPDAAELERIAASYRVDTRESERLRFVGFGEGLPDGGQWRDGFAVADMNGDGHLDIVHGPPRKSFRTPVIFLGDGKGSWRRWREARFPPLAYDYGDVQVGPIGGGGRPGMVLAVHLRGLIALSGDGLGQFTSAGTGLDFATDGPAGAVPGFFSRAIRLIDWNRDGRLDVLALGEGPQLAATRGRTTRSASRGVVVYLGQADGSWIRRDQGTGADQIFGTSIAPGDFNGDGRPDFAIGTAVQGRRDLVNLGLPDGGWRPVTVEAVRPMAYVRAVAAADFDRDGRDDLAIGYLSFEGATWRTGVDILFPRADGSWARRMLAAEPGRAGVNSLAAGDVDGDGRLDLVALTGDGQPLVFLGDGAGSFTREKQAIAAFGNGCRGSHVELADVDGDGVAEIIASFAQEPTSGSPRGRCPSEGGLAAWKSLPIRGPSR